jgi:hypothetical protein
MPPWGPALPTFGTDRHTTTLTEAGFQEKQSPYRWNFGASTSFGGTFLAEKPPGFAGPLVRTTRM